MMEKEKRVDEGGVVSALGGRGGGEGRREREREMGGRVGRVGEEAA
jgi:hypothetical protein